MKVRNRERLLKKIAALPKVTREEIGAALRKSGDEITTLQRQFAPRDEGALVGSIGNEYSDPEMRVTMFAGGEATTKPVREGADASYDYAFGAEFGNKRVPAQPYFFPAYRLGKKRAKSRITRAVNKAARKVAGK